MPHPATAPFDSPSVSGSYARALRSFLDSRGLPSGGSAAGMDGVRVGGDALGEALVAGGRELGDPLLGLRFGTRVGCAGFGLLGVAAATATTLGEAVRRLHRFESLTSTLGCVRVRRAGSAVTLAWRPVGPVAPQVVEGILAGWVSFGRYMLGEHVRVRGLGFAHRRASAISEYEQQLECPVRFGSDEASLTIDADLMDARPRWADARVNAALDAWLDRCTVAVAAPESLATTRRVAGLLASLGAPGDIDERELAAALGLHRRTLQRRLAHEGASFRALLDAARAQHAIVSLLDGAPRLTELGADIGFHEQSSLCRAFRRWTGYAPLPLKARLGPVFQYLRPALDPLPPPSQETET